MRFMGPGSLANADLGRTIITGLGLSAEANDFRHTQPQLARGITASANTYTAFLRKRLDRRLIAGAQLNGDGAFGVYRWIEPTKANDGVMARADFGANPGGESVPCGSKLRLPWATGMAP